MKQYIKGTITFQSGNSIQYSSSDISGDVSISSQCVCSQGISLGGVCTAELNMTLIISGVNRYDMLGAVIDVKTSYNGTDWESIGKFNVVSAQRYYNDITVTAYDNIILFDSTAFTSDENSKKINQIYLYLKSERSIYDVLAYVVNLAEMELGNTREEIEAMPNGQKTLIMYAANGNAYLRDWLSWCAEFLGGFAYADGNGKIRIKQFETLPSITIQKSEIQADTAEIADFSINNFDISITCYDETWYKTYTVLGEGESPNTVVYLDLQDNILAQGYYHLVKNRYSDDIPSGEIDSERTKKMYSFTGDLWDSLSNARFRPFQATAHINELLYIGQCVQIQDIEGDFYSINITHHTWTLNGGQQIKCAGEDTRLLADTKSRTALKRQSEKIETMIKNVGKDVTQTELDQLVTDGKIVDGQTYYVYEE